MRPAESAAAACPWACAVRLGALSLAFLLLAAGAGCTDSDPGREAAQASGASDTPASLDMAVRYVHPKDGDSFTVELHGVRTDIRLIGVDCPEKGRPGADAAREFAHAWLSSGSLGLEYDAERYDRYDRTLAYVWRGPDMLNLELVRAGLCAPRHWPPNDRHRALLEAVAP